MENASSDKVELEVKICPNCGISHRGMFDDCYPCFDCETEVEYQWRREEALRNKELNKI